MLCRLIRWTKIGIDILTLKYCILLENKQGSNIKNKFLTKVHIDAGVIKCYTLLLNR